MYSTNMFNPESIKSLTPEDQALFSKFCSGDLLSVPFPTVHAAFQHHTRLTRKFK